MTKPTRLAALLLAVAFLAGVLFGLVGHTFYERTARADAVSKDPKQMREKYLATLESRLALSPEQLNQLRDISDQTDQRFRELKDRMEPEFEAVRQSHRERVMAILTPDQQPKYQQYVEERRREHERKKNGQRR